MTRLLRNVADDLVHKKLWPLAVLLLAGIIAVPVLLGGGSAPVAPPAGEVVAGTAGDEPALLTLDQGGRAERLGAVRRSADPFRRVAKPRDADADGGGNANTVADAAAFVRKAFGGIVGGGGSGGGASAAAAPGGSAGGGAAPTPSPTPAPAPVTPPRKVADDADEGSSIDLRFGRSGRLRELRDVPPLTPLPSADDPFFVFVGVLDDGKTARFLVSSDAVATGDGSCKPSKTACERIELVAGDTEFFDFTGPDGEVVQFQLDLRAVRHSGPVKRTTARSAALSARREAVAGVATGHRADLRFGPSAGGDAGLAAHRDLTGLTALPAAGEPGAVFVGVLDDGATALLLNPAGAAVGGDATCRPDPRDCARFEVPAGGRATLALPAPGGGTTEHTVVVDAIAPERGKAWAQP